MKDEILKILTESELFTIVDNIKDSTIIQVSVSKKDVNEDLNYKLMEVLVNETIKELYKNSKSYITKNAECSYCDFMKNDIEDVKGSNIFMHLIKSISEKKCITNGRYMSVILDSLYDPTVSFSNVVNNSNRYLPYKSFETNNLEIFTDPYLTFYDNKLITFDQIYIDVKSVSILDNEFNIELRFEYGIDAKNLKLYYIIESEKSEGYVDFIKRVRRGRIKGIVEE